jgi:quercetin dioxygenase-like cupin family protein
MTRKISVNKLFAAVAITVFVSCGNKQKEAVRSSAIFPKGDKTPSAYFTGNAYLKPLVARDKNNEFVIGSVTFEPAARTNWHSHPKGQVLIITDGDGIYKERDKPARPIKKGDVVNVPDNVEH